MSDVPRIQPPTVDPPNPETLVRLGLRFYGVVALIALAWRVGLYREPIFFRSAETAARGIAPVHDLAVGLVVVAATVGLSQVATRRTRWGEALARSLAAEIGPITLRQSLILAGASGVAEELLFRGALQPRVGLLWASVIFGVVHFMPRREMLLWVLFTFAMGLVLGALYDWTGNLLAPVVVHFGMNAINLQLLARDYRSSTAAVGPEARQSDPWPGESAIGTDRE